MLNKDLLALAIQEQLGLGLNRPRARWKSS